MARNSHLDWVPYRTNFKLPIFYDAFLHTIDPFHDYITYLANQKLLSNSNKQAYKSEIEATSYALKSLLDFLSEIKIEWEDVNDYVLSDYRDWALNKTLLSQTSKQDGNTAKRSINIKIRNIYHFFVWAQDYAKIIHNHIGSNDQPIKSELPNKHLHVDRKKMNQKNYPLCFIGIGENSSSNTQYTATPDDKHKLIHYFTKNHAPEVAERNIIIMEIADQVGWRSGSILNLTTDQFSWSEIENEDGDSILVKPSVQKFGYQFSFEVPIGLAAWVARFIDQRKELQKKKGWNEKVSEHRIFLNINTGRPLGGKTISQFFSKAFSSIGAPRKRNAGIHSFRRKFTQEATAKEIHERRELGLSTAGVDVMFPIARYLGQKNIHSQEAYQKVIYDDIKQSPTSKIEKHARKVEQMLAEKELENAKLRKIIADIKK